MSMESDLRSNLIGKKEKNPGTSSEPQENDVVQNQWDAKSFADGWEVTTPMCLSYRTCYRAQTDPTGRKVIR